MLQGQPAGKDHFLNFVGSFDHLGQPQAQPAPAVFGVSSKKYDRNVGRHRIRPEFREEERVSCGQAQHDEVGQDEAEVVKGGEGRFVVRRSEDPEAGLVEGGAYTATDVDFRRHEQNQVVAHAPVDSMAVKLQ